jgi:hypothetical protein
VIILIIGFNKKTYRVKGQAKAQKCQKCSHERPFKIVEEKKWFTFLFIPLFSYKKRELLVCSICGAGYETKGVVQKVEDTQVRSVENKESLYKAIKAKFENGEISKNEFIRMINVIDFETQH